MPFKLLAYEATCHSTDIFPTFREEEKARDYTLVVLQYDLILIKIYCRKLLFF